MSFLPPAFGKGTEAKLRTLSRGGLSASAPSRLPTAPGKLEERTLGLDNFEDDEDEAIAEQLRRLDTASSVHGGVSLVSSTRSNGRPGTSRFTSEEVNCFRKVYTPSRQYRGKAEVYWQTTGNTKKNLSESCWHSLPVLKGKFYSQDLLQDHNQKMTVSENNKPVKKFEAVAMLPDEQMTANVLHEIYPATPTRRDSSCSNFSPEKDSPFSAMRKSGRVDVARPKRIARAGSPVINTVAGLAESGRSIAVPSALSSSTGSNKLASAVVATQASGIGISTFGSSDRATSRSLAPLKEFRGMLLDKYGSLEYAFEVWGNDMPSSNMMTRKEFRRILQSKMSVEMPQDQRDSIYNLLDLNSLGQVGFSEFRIMIESAGPVQTIGDLRRRWLMAGFRSMMTVLRLITDKEAFAGDRLSFQGFGELLNRVHVNEHSEHSAIFNAIADPQDRQATVTIEELTAAVSIVSPNLLIEDLRLRLLQKYVTASHSHLKPFKKAWADLEHRAGESERNSEIQLPDFVLQSVRRFGLTEGEAAKVFRFMDRESRGFVTRTQFLSSLSLSDPALVLEDLRHKIRQCFHSIESVMLKAYEFQEQQKVSRLSLDHYQELFGHLNLTDADIEIVFNLIDVDQFGSLTIEDFARGVHYFAPGCAFEDLRLMCMQRHSKQNIRSLFATVDFDRLRRWQGVDTWDQASIETARMDYPMFVELFEELRLDCGLRLRFLFDVLDAKSEGTASLCTLFSLLQAGGAGTVVKMEDDTLKMKAKQDIRNYTTSAYRLVGDVKAEAREGKKHTLERLACLHGSLELPDDAGTQEPQRPESPTRPKTTQQQRQIAPRLRPVPHQEIRDYVLQQSMLGPLAFGPHSRAGEFRKLTEKSVNNPQHSFNEVWKSLQSCPKLDDRNGIEKDLLGYYQSACWSLSSDVALLECPPSRFKLHCNSKTHRGALEVDSKRANLRSVKE
mmetsp:Transcript_24517/g.39293  ORF Transcript_24517/g.39293 Transcript_24517/m.39293 type:complete len:954 (+) Transcript_24517:81-2942(+)